MIFGKRKGTLGIGRFDQVVEICGRENEGEEDGFNQNKVGMKNLQGNLRPCNSSKR